MPQDTNIEQDKEAPIIYIPKPPANVVMFDVTLNQPPGRPTPVCISQYYKPEERQPSRYNIRYQAINIINYVITKEIMLTLKLATETHQRMQDFGAANDAL